MTSIKFMEALGYRSSEMRRGMLISGFILGMVVICS